MFQNIGKGQCHKLTSHTFNHKRTQAVHRHWTEKWDSSLIFSCGFIYISEILFEEVRNNNRAFNELTFYLQGFCMDSFNAQKKMTNAHHAELLV